MPGDLPADLPICLVHDDLFRSHQAARECLHFGKTAAHRFDCPEKTFGVCYVGLDSFGCFAETFRKQPPSRNLLKQRVISLITTLTPLKLVDLRNSEVRRVLGIVGEIATAHDRAGTQAWAKALHDHPEKPDGILYPADHDSKRGSIALFDRARPRLTAQIISQWFEHPDLPEILRIYFGFTLADLPD